MQQKAGKTTWFTSRSLGCPGAQPFSRAAKAPGCRHAAEGVGPGFVTWAEDEDGAGALSGQPQGAGRRGGGATRGRATRGRATRGRGDAGCGIAGARFLTFL
jgi:hypothetical protein